MSSGDFTAVVAPKTEDDDRNAVGDNPINHQSARDNVLVQLSRFHGLRIASTPGTSSFDDAWTYRNADVCKQVDNLLTDPKLVKYTICCGVIGRLEIGSDAEQ